MATTATSTGRGWSGHSGEPVRLLLCAKEREKRLGYDAYHAKAKRSRSLVKKKR
jgi:hypothetical protein